MITFSPLYELTKVYSHWLRENFRVYVSTLQIANIAVGNQRLPFRPALTFKSASYQLNSIQQDDEAINA
jgi:hypothetical protein